MLHKRGFSLTELLVVVAVLGILITIAIVSVAGNRDKADDAKTKSDLDRLRIAFEDYYNDNNCYPPPAWFDDETDCNSGNLRPYLNTIPCDKQTGLPYKLEKDSSGCSWFRLYAELKNAAIDPQAQALCDPAGSTLGNYGVSSGNTQALVLCDSPAPSVAGSPTPTPTPSSTPTPTPTPPTGPEGDYYCAAIGNCQYYSNLIWTCTPNYTVANCGGACSYSTGSCILD